MSRLLVLAVIGGLSAASSGCYEPVYVPKKPMPAKIVRNNAVHEINRAFKQKPELKRELPKFLEKLGEAESTSELREAWLAVYPGYPYVIDRTFAKSHHDFYWPVAPVTDARVYVDGFRRAAEEVADEAPPQS
jgi:hypothetical protein